MPRTRQLVIILLVVIIAAAAAGCGNGVAFNPRSPSVTLTLTSGAVPETDEPEYAADMTDALLQAVTDKDYASFSLNLSRDMKGEIPEDKFNRMAADFSELIGTYTGEREYILTHEDGDTATVMYRAEYTGEPEGVSVTIAFAVEGEYVEIIALYFNSPKLRGE